MVETTQVAARIQDSHGADGADTRFGLERAIFLGRAQPDTRQLLKLIGKYLVTLEPKLKGLTGQRVWNNK